MPTSTIQNSASESASSTELIGLPTLMTLAFNDSEKLIEIGNCLYARLQQNQFDANALLDISTYLILRGENKVALSMQSIAIKTQQVFHYPRSVLPIKIRLLALLGPGDLMANSPFEFLIEGQAIALDLLYITPQLGLPEVIPEHDVLIIAISESEQNQSLLQQAAQLIANWPRPVLNHPERIRLLTRDSSCAQLAPLPGVAMPVTQRISRAALERCCEAPETASTLAQQLAGVDYPIIIRPIDSHAGQGLSKITTVAELTGYLIESPESQFFVSRFIDYHNQDGLYRKYRIILINGKPYVCHMAISQRWMVHYLNADMLENAAHREEEANFMANFDSDFAVRHASAFTAIYTQLGLDYVGIDCAQTPDGQLLIFEVDSNMIVHSMDSAQIFPYKKIQMPKVFNAFGQLLAQRSGIAL